MSYSETANDIYKAGVQDDKFILIANSNKECQVAIKTPWGSLTETRAAPASPSLHGGRCCHHQLMWDGLHQGQRHSSSKSRNQAAGTWSHKMLQ